MFILSSLNKSIFLFAVLYTVCNAITKQQFEQSLDMTRSGCAPKFKIPVEALDKLRNGEFNDDITDLRCYTKCVAQMAGTLTKKGEMSITKAIAQIPFILPEEMHEVAKAAFEACKDIQKNYKDSCDKTYFTTKCVRDFNPTAFRFP